MDTTIQISIQIWIVRLNRDLNSGPTQLAWVTHKLSRCTVSLPKQPKQWAATTRQHFTIWQEHGFEQNAKKKVLPRLPKQLRHQKNHSRASVCKQDEDWMSLWTGQQHNTQQSNSPSAKSCCAKPDFASATGCWCRAHTSANSCSSKQQRNNKVSG